MSASRPWWLEEGEQQCIACQHRFRYEAGYFCLDCDGPLCPVCVRYRVRSDDVVCGTCEPDHDRKESG